MLFVLSQSDGIVGCDLDTKLFLPVFRLGHFVEDPVIFAISDTDLVFHKPFVFKRNVVWSLVGIIPEFSPAQKGVVPFGSSEFAECGRDVFHGFFFETHCIAGLGVGWHGTECKVARPAFTLGRGIDIFHGAFNRGVQAICTAVHQIDSRFEPASTDLKVVVLDRLVDRVGLERFVFVVAEQFPQNDRFVSKTQLVVVSPGCVPLKVGRILVLGDPVANEVDPLLDPVVFVFRGIPFDRDVVSQIPRLIGPHSKEVRLEFGDQVHRGLHAVPFLDPLKFDGASPKHVGGHAPGTTQQCQFEHEAAGVHFTKGGFTEIETIFFAVKPLPVGIHDPEQNEDDNPVTDFAIAEYVRHAATSRFLSTKKPATENGRA